jgi:hypothetical protein
MAKRVVKPKPAYDENFHITEVRRRQSIKLGIYTEEYKYTPPLRVQLYAVVLKSTYILAIKNPCEETMLLQVDRYEGWLWHDAIAPYNITTPTLRVVRAMISKDPNFISKLRTYPTKVQQAYEKVLGEDIALRDEWLIVKMST